MIDHIKQETFSVVTNCILKNANKGISRREISDITGFSVMTVGKVISSLTGQGFLESKRSDISKGRHADLVFPSDKIRYIIVSISDTSFSIKISDGSMNILSVQNYLCNPDLSFEENLQTAVFNAKLSIKDNYSLTCCATVRQDKNMFGTSKHKISDSLYDIITDRSFLVRSQIALRYRRYTALYVGCFENGCTVSLYDKGKYIESVNIRIEQKNIGRSLNDLAEKVDRLCSLHTPNILISESACTSQTVIRAIEEKISNNIYPIRAVYFPDMSFSDRDIFSALCKAMSIKVTEKVYDQSSKEKIF